MENPNDSGGGPTGLPQHGGSPSVEFPQPELLTCPFCGAPAKLDWTEVPDFSAVLGGPPREKPEYAFTIHCGSKHYECPMGHHYLVNTPEKAAAAWNRRACHARSVCTAVRPMPVNAPGQWVHPDATSDESTDRKRDDPYYDHYVCPHCGTRFAEEVAE